MLAADTSNDGTILGHDIVERDRRVRLEDIRRYVSHGVLREENGWAREEEEWTMRRKEEEEDTKSSEKRGGTAMGEPHAWRRQDELAPVEGRRRLQSRSRRPRRRGQRHGRRAWTRSLQITNVRQKETRGIKTMLRRGEDNPREIRGNSERGGHAGMTMMPAFKPSSRILSSAKTFP